MSLPATDFSSQKSLSSESNWKQLFKAFSYAFGRMLILLNAALADNMNWWMEFTCKQEYDELLHEFMMACKQAYGEKVLVQVCSPQQLMLRLQNLE